jgi:hypothetical protein
MKIHITSALVLLGLILSPAAAWADSQQEQQDRDACMMDAQMVCGQFIPDRERVAHCLMTNRSKISPACREAIKHFK